MNAGSSYPLISAIDSPADLRKLPASELENVAAELRQYLIETVSQMGGHFAAGLGAVELTVALHYVFDTPHDRLVWDVGHQAYPHKVLTGRRNQLKTIKCKGGLAPFPTRSESPYDTFGVGHSSTSISAALGMAIAAARNKEQRRVVAVIGDGAMSAGMAFEALNHAGSLDVDMLVVLNDNDMSISENVGAFSNYFARVLSGKLYATLREGSKKVLKRMPTVWELARRSEEHMKGMVLPGTIFEELGFNYIGTDRRARRRRARRHAQELARPEGAAVPARHHPQGQRLSARGSRPDQMARARPFDPKSGVIFKEKATGPSYSQVFGQWVCDMAAMDPKIVAITPAMREGSGLVEYSKRFPDRISMWRSPSNMQ
jgi:1-deoxy-D-xylulose-5-phosphate synthase (EC 2.2.1.7)